MKDGKLASIGETSKRGKYKSYYEKTKIKEEIYMITFIILAAVLGLVLIVASGVGVMLLDPIIAIFLIWGVYKLIKMCINGFKK